MGMHLDRQLEAACLRLAGAKAGPAGSGDLCQLFAATRQAGYSDPVPEHPLHPGRKWRFDWCWPDLMVALEREGGEFRAVSCPCCGWAKKVFVSRHHSRDGLEKDVSKYNAAACMGWLLVRITPPMLRDGRAEVAVLSALSARTGACTNAKAG